MAHMKLTQDDPYLQPQRPLGMGSTLDVHGFSSCLRVPRQTLNDPGFITVALVSIGVRHDRLLYLVEDVVDKDLIAALRLLHVCRIQRFGHIISYVHPPPFGSPICRC